MSWSSVRGHDAVVQAFARAVQRGRLAHAYLFVGPHGIGKRRFARELAKTLLCEGGPPAAERATFAACDRCPACIQVVAGTHPDLVVHGRPEESHELPIAVVRELCQAFGLKSARGRGKVAILDDADELNEEAANGFLKTLEEPPPGSLLILIGTSPELQLRTIVSRCQVVHFAPLSATLVAEVLQANEVDAALVPRLVRLAAGSPGQALALADPALWEFRSALLAALTQPRFDSVALGRQWGQFVEEAGKESASQRRRASLAIGLLIDFLSSALHLATEAGLADTSAEDQETLRQLANRLGADGLLAAIQRCLEADAQVDRRVQLLLVLDALTDALAQRWARTAS
jgi:DNA polymerase-3 subunit delta'